MKKYFIKVFFGWLAIGIMYGIAYIFNVDWLKGSYGNLFIIIIGFVTGAVVGTLVE
ncbi:MULTISPECIES: hypothetical protein [Bacillaceae]|uniref:hypothetical protein n=1 Tax=Bacillaceae TaxID=186817 RepID=UPI000AF94B37|nr:hypothetical protein [Bacillus sp. FJAT-25509]